MSEPGARNLLSGGQSPTSVRAAKKAGARKKPATKSRRSTKEPDDVEELSSPGRPIWKGSISFGLVNVPVTLFSLERKFDLHFRLIDSRDQSGIRYERVNESTGKEVPWDQIVRAYEYADGNYVVLEEEDFKRAVPEATQTVEIESFVDEVEIDDTYFDKPYIVVPAKKAEKGYVLLREVLNRTGKAGIAKVVIRSREYLAAVLARGDALIVNLLRFSQELRKLSSFGLPRGDVSEYRVSEREIDLAEQLVESMADEWRPAQYTDAYREALLKWIETKAEKGEMATVAQAEEKHPVSESANVIDLAALLRESMKSAPSKNGKPAKKAAAR